jgi:hypothetical protein
VSSIPEVGAVCGKAARTDLCGGREATRVPTAKPKRPAGPPMTLDMREFGVQRLVALA